MKRLLGLLSALALVACLDATGPGPSNPLNETFAASLNINLKDTAVWKRTANGTFYKEEILGTGASLFLPDPTDSLFVGYFGYLKDGSLFDSSSVARFAVNRLAVIGFVDGMVNMKVGGQRLVVIPSELAYGNATVGPIPANSTLIFRIKLNGFFN